MDRGKYKMTLFILKEGLSLFIKQPCFYEWINFEGWRDCVGIEPTEDGTRLPGGFEDRGTHQTYNQPHEVICILLI